MSYNMGIGALGNSTGIMFKRKFRWLFSVEDICSAGGISRVPESFVKSAARPNVTFEETEINFLHGKMYLPGKATFESITVTYYDVTNDQTSPLVPLYSWIANVYDFLSPEGGITNPRMNARAYDVGARAHYGGRGVLTMLDGGGLALEAWTLYDCWPQAVNFGDLDYATQDEATIELTVRYQFAKWQNFCGAQPAPCFGSTCGANLPPGLNAPAGLNGGRV